MIPAERFLAQSHDRDRWLNARVGRVTATTVAKAATPGGFQTVLAGGDVHVNEFMEFGTQSEAAILDHAHHTFGILPSDWLISSEHNPLHAATADGLSPDHTLIAEAKTTGTDWRTVPALYRRQVQWQLYVTGAEKCLFLWQLRLPDDLGWFYTPWLEPKTIWIERDPDTIDELCGVADRLLEAGYVG